MSVTKREILDFVEIYTDDMERLVIDSVVPGFCTNCGAETDRIEPDSRDGWCHDCGKNRVVSIIELYFDYVGWN